MNCKHCDVEMRVIETHQRQICDVCQYSEPLVPQDPIPRQDIVELLDRQVDFRCPQCESDFMEIGRLHKSEVCCCPSCNGLVVDRASLGDLVEAMRLEYSGEDEIPAPANLDALDRLLPCPACAQNMEMMFYCGPGNVVLASCDTCKLSCLEDGDFDRIIRAPGNRDYRSKLGNYTLLSGALGFEIIRRRGRS